MKKILVTGGAGFIGSSLVLKLLNKDYKVVVLDNLSEQIHGKDPERSFTYNLIKDKVKFIKGDVRNIDDWKNALKDIDIVVHLAAETGTGQSMYEINKYIETNIGGTGKLLEILTNGNHKVNKLIIASSRSVYGEGKFKCNKHGIVYPEARKEVDMVKGDFEVKCPICKLNVSLLATDEESLLHPTSVYGFSKQAQEQLCLIVGKSIKIPVVAFRFHNVYGPGQSLKNPYTGILSIFSTRIKNGNDINIFEDGNESRDFVYIDDVTDAILLGIEKDNANNKIFNVGSGERSNVISVAETLYEKYEVKTKMKISGNYRLGDIRHNIADVSYINKELGYKSKVTIQEGISKFIDWVEQQEVETDNYNKSIQEMKKKGLFK